MTLFGALIILGIFQMVVLMAAYLTNIVRYAILIT
jgi:hypothetical protein